MYVIKFNRIFETGYVRSKFTLQEPKTINFKTEEECLQFASKYRFKFHADLDCWIFNKKSDLNFELVNYYVVKI